jgi:DNA-binding beta-propeller fold protein YncE
MSNEMRNSVMATTRSIAAAALSLAVLLLVPADTWAGKKKNVAPAAPPELPILERLDYSKIVWPNPPNITRIKYLDFFAGEKTPEKGQKAKKSGWMDRLAGTQVQGDAGTAAAKYKLWSPYGITVDSKGKIYVADPRVGAIFIFNAENKDDVGMLKNGAQAKFGLVIGLAIDDGDRLFASDSQLRRVLVFDKNHKQEASITEGLREPAGLAIDNENRFLYVADVELDQVLVYDVDSLHLLRKIGTTGRKHELTDEGNFSKPTNVAVDSEGNLYVSDTMNNRIEEFDADGNFIRAFGKAGDGPGYFARPKGIAIDADDHVWVADSTHNRVQVFTKEGRLLIWMGGNGLLPGQFSAVTGLAIDKANRVFTSEQMVGRVQMFRYFTNEEALAEKKRRDAEAEQKKSGKHSAVTAPSADPGVAKSQ